MDIVIVVPISRDRYLPRFFQCLNDLHCDPMKTRILLYVDGDIVLFQKVQQYALNLKYIDKSVRWRRRGIPSDNHIMRRRERIAEIHNELREHIKQIDVNYLLLLEDDTHFPPETLDKLLSNIDDKVGIISGIQIGRWGFPMVGAWDKTNDEIKSFQFDKEMFGLYEISAAGLYCCLVKRECYINHEFKPYGVILGPDVNFGISLENIGFKNYIDVDVKCGHMTQKETLTFDDIKTVQVRFTRDNDNPTGWKQDIIENKDGGCSFC